MATKQIKKDSMRLSIELSPEAVAFVSHNMLKEYIADFIARRLFPDFLNKSNVREEAKKKGLHIDVQIRLR